MKRRISSTSGQLVQATAHMTVPFDVLPAASRDLSPDKASERSVRALSERAAGARRIVACCVTLLMSQAALGDDAIRVENGTLAEDGQLDLSGTTTLVFPRSAKVTRAERPDVLISARKQLAFDGQPPRSMLMTHWRHYLGVMYCRDGERMYLFPYGEWDTRPKGRRGRPRGGAVAGGGGAAVNLKLTVPVPLQVISNTLPPKQGPCSAQYPSAFTDEPATESYWYTHSTPPPNWTRVELTERAGKKRAGGT